LAVDNCAKLVSKLAWVGPDQWGDVAIDKDDMEAAMAAAINESDEAPLTTENLIQEFGFKPVEGGTEHDIFLEVAGGAWLRTWPEFRDREGERRFYLEKGNNVWALGLLRPRTKGQLRRLLALLADIQASLGGEEGNG
jgi:hypothetical protein